MERLTIKKEDIETRTPRVTLQRDNKKTLTLSFGGNLDLYFILSNFDNDPSFIISKDNYAIYEIFDRLYNDIKECNIFTPNKLEIVSLRKEAEFFGVDFNEKLEDYLANIEKSNQELKERRQYQSLFKNDAIVWLSDDFPNDVAPYFKIKKDLDNYIIEFNRENLDKDSLEDIFYYKNESSIYVRLRNSGSRYDPFNILFMKAFRSLKEINENNEQVHIEEYLFEKNKALARTLK